MNITYFLTWIRIFKKKKKTVVSSLIIWMITTATTTLAFCLKSLRWPETSKTYTTYIHSLVYDTRILRCFMSAAAARLAGKTECKIFMREFHTFAKWKWKLSNGCDFFRLVFFSPTLVAPAPFYRSVGVHTSLCI